MFEREDSGVISAYVAGLPMYAQGGTQARAERAIRRTLTAYLEAHPDATSAAAVKVATVSHGFARGRRHETSGRDCERGGLDRPTDQSSQSGELASKWAPGRTPPKLEVADYWDTPQLRWRRERDSNPRYPCGYSGFQDHRTCARQPTSLPLDRSRRDFRRRWSPGTIPLAHGTDQNVIRSPNWICRAGAAELITPNVDDPKTVPGFAKFVWFRTLNTSARNSARIFSVTVKVRIRDIST